MEKLSRLSDRESSGEQSLEGVYRVVVDLHLSSDKKVTLADIEKKVAELGATEDLSVERYSTRSSPSAFNVGDSIELIAEFNCTKSVYLDAGGNLVISDRPVVESVEKVGDFNISLPKNTFAEVNKRSADGMVEILFTGETVELAELERVAYLGVLAVPCNLIAKSVI